jgi:SAM-dependent methyltransferase
MRNSYTSDAQTFIAHLRQVASLTRIYSGNPKSRVAHALGEIKKAENMIWEQYATRLVNLDILEIGPGQFLGQMPYLSSRGNRVVGVDRDVITQLPNVGQFIRMIRNNGSARAFKTFGRKLLGVDRRYRLTLRKQLGLRSLPKCEISHAHADELPFGDESFDLVYTRAVFQHLPRPSDVIKEITRVLRPRGIAFISLQPYTSPTGCLDPRILYGTAGKDLAAWPHLRPELQGKVSPNAYLNRLGLCDWQRIFIADTKDPVFGLTPVDDQFMLLAAVLREAGHLLDYSMEELTTSALDVMFRVPE